MGGSPTNYPVQSNPEKEAATYARLKKQGMSDQGITAPEQIIPALKSFGSDLKKGIQDKLGMNEPRMMMMQKEKIKEFPDQELEVLQPRSATIVKGVISPSGIQQDSLLDRIKYNRDARPSKMISFDEAFDSGIPR